MTLLTGEHDTNSLNCWCHPEIMSVCSECLGDHPPIGKPDPDCWKCGGRGLVDVPAIDIAMFSHGAHDPWLIIHRERWAELGEGDE